MGMMFLVLALTMPATGQDSADATRQPSIEPRAEELLKAMSDRLAGLQRFAFSAEETFDELSDGEPRMELSNVRRIAVERPGRLAADATGDTLARASWYDGKSVTLLDKAHNTYGRVEVPATIDAALDTLVDEYGIVQPLTDLLYSDVYSVLIEGVTYGRYLGIHRAAGVDCHHLAFAQETIEWQLWIDAGDDPLPRKMVITYVHEPGEPQYAATIQKWNLDPKFPAELFTFEPPEGAQKVEFARLIGAATEPEEGQ